MAGTIDPILKRLFSGGQSLWHHLSQWRMLLVMVLVSLLLSGCIQYDVGVRFHSPSSGTLTQRILVSERLRRFSDATAEQYLRTIERQTRQVGGQVERLSNQELQVTIPFGDARDLEKKFNQFFNSADAERLSSATEDLPAIESHLSASRSNLLLVERTRLRYDLDLRSLGVLSTNGNLLISPGSLVQLEFALETPWGARSIISSGTKPPSIRQAGRQLVWTLTPGEINQIEAVFWMPNFLGIGTGVIGLLVVVGQSLKYPRSSAAIKTGSQQATP